MALLTYPTMVPVPIEFFEPKASARDVNSSGAELPAARKVAPATSGIKFKASDIVSKDCDLQEIRRLGGSTILYACIFV